jgi:prepilin-type N-terminal cleavage/methylation domain-containing protein
MQQHTNESGFSLIELVVGIGILTVLMGAAFNLMVRGQQSFDSNQILAQAHQNAEFAVQRVSEIIRGSGCNPTQVSTVNSLQFVQNAGSTSSIRVKSDMDGDGTFNDIVALNSASASWAISPEYLILSAEDVTIAYYPTATTVGGTTVPGRCITIADNVGSNTAPVVIAQNITAFKAEPTSNFKEVIVTITAGPNPPFQATDPRFRTYTTGTRIRLRNR